MITPGTVIKGFVVREHIGSGGFGDVYRVRDLRSGQAFALKLSRASLTGQRNRQQVLESFVNEVSLVSKLRGHSAIAKIYRSILYTDRTGDHLGIVMELVRGVPLDLYIYNKGKLVETQALPLFLQIVDAVRHAHECGILHRDIKPGNIMVLPQKNGMVEGLPTHPIKMLDFGLAKTMEQAAAVESLSGVSLPYMSPERLIPGGRIDIRTDVYSLGATLYEMLTGSQPFSITSFPEALSIIPTTRPPSIRASYAYHPAWLDAVVQKAMAKDPQQRYPDCAALARALTGRPPTPSQRPQPAYPQRGTSATPARPRENADWDGSLPGARGPFLEWFMQSVLGVAGIFPPPQTGVVPGSVGRRALACLIDLAVLLGINVVLPRFGLPLAKSGTLPALVFLACFLYPTCCEAWFGATLGKGVLGLRVIPQSRWGEWQLSPLRSGLRTLLKYPLLLALPMQYVSWPRLGFSFWWFVSLLAAFQVVLSVLDLLCIMETRGGVSLHDALAHTLVAQRRSGDAGDGRAW